MSKLGKYTKQSGEIETYTIDYADDLTDGDGLLSPATASVSPAGLTIDYVNVIENGTDHRVRVKVSGGTNDTEYKVTVVANTEDGRRLEDEFYVKIKDI